MTLPKFHAIVEVVRNTGGGEGEYYANYYAIFADNSDITNI